MKNKQETIADFLDDSKKQDNITSGLEEKPVSLEEIAEVIAPEGEPKKTKKRRSKKEIDSEKSDESYEVEKRAMALSLIGITKSIALILDEPVWSLEDREEADFLAESTILFLDKVYPSWRKSSPYLDFISAWTAYFIKRVFIKKVIRKADDAE